MSHRIAVITTTPPGFNPGMVATELGLVAFLRRHGWFGQSAFFQVMPFRDRLAGMTAEERDALIARGDAGIEHRSGEEQLAAIARSDVVLLWADFLHMGEHIRQMQAVVDASRAARGEAPAPSLVAKLFLLEDVDDDVLARTLSFGTSLLFNTLRDELDPAYAAPLTRFMTKARRVWVRDALSAARVAHLRRDYRSGYFGVDAALMLRREDVLARAPRDAAGEGDVLVFFGRDAVHRGELAELAARLAAARGRPLRWLPWGDGRAFPALAQASAGNGEDPDIDALLGDVARASLIVTDTYHLAVNAWNLGVPAVAAFAGRTTNPADVSSGAEFNWRDKREVFFSQYDALDFLIRPEELDDGEALQRREQRILAALADSALLEAIVANIRDHARCVEADMAAEIAGLLDGAARRRGPRSFFRRFARSAV